MEQESLAARIERQIAERAGLEVAVEDDDGAIILTGLVDSDENRAAALDIARALAPDRRIESNLDLTPTLPAPGEDLTEDTPLLGELPTSAPGDYAIEPDLTAQPLQTTNVEDFAEPMELDTATVDILDETENVQFAPTDPVITTDRHGQTQVLGGFAPTAEDASEAVRTENPVRGDEALADAVRQALRSDASTTDLQIDVQVRQGVVRLRGVVPGLEDAENAESVAGDVPGVDEVIEELQVREL